jgi:hypothetical protein
MGGAYVMGLGWDIASTPITTLEDCGRLVTFMESTNFNEMAPHDELKFGGTEYMLALPGDSYIAYASSLSGDIGLQNMTPGLYDLTWYDVTNGNTVVQTNIDVEAGNVTWSKPVDIGNEMAVYIRRLDSELIVDFGSGGIWDYDGSSWTGLASSNPEHLAVYDNKLVGDFGSGGLWEFDGTSWSQLTTLGSDSTGNRMMAYGTSLVIDFGSGGIWEYDGSAWSSFAASDPEFMVIYDNKLVADFGSGGLWEFDGTSWSQLASSDADSSSNCMVAIDFM